MREIPSRYARRVARRPLMLVAALLGLAAPLVAGCANASAGAVSPTPTPATHGVSSVSITAVVSIATATPGSDCATLTPGPAGSAPGFPLPPNTVSGSPNGTAGAGYTIECTPGATQASITTFLNTSLSQAGWQRWNPQTQDAHGCGTQPNDFWQWTKNDASGGAAVGWQFKGPALPEWMLVVCSLAYGR